MRWTVGWKIALGYLLALLALVAIGLTAHRSLEGLLGAANWKDHTYAVLGQLDSVATLLKDAETGQRGYLLTGQERYLEPYVLAVRKLDNTLQALQQATRDNPAQQQRLQQVRQATANKLAELKQTIDLRRDAGQQAAIALVLTDQGKRDMDALRHLLAEMEAEERALLQQRDATMQGNAVFAMALVTYGIPLVALLVLGVAALVTRNIAIPLRSLADAARAISQGDLAPRLTSLTRSDELGVLNQAFLQMIATLRLKAAAAVSIAQGDLRAMPMLASEQDELGLAFRTMVTNLQSVVADMRQGSQAMESVVGTVMTGTTQVATAADETATATTQLATTIAELRQTTELTSQRMAEVSGSALMAAEVARSGQVAVNEVVRGMQDIQGRMGVVAERIGQLTDKSLAISDIVNAVNALSEQSAILAVNASIEAAHADEQGQGFAVVAHEMKSLAGQSKQAVVQVRGILLEIQQLITALVMATEHSVAAVESGVAQSGVAGDALARMSTTAAANAQAAQQIAVTAMQQATGVQQIAAAVHHIKQGNNDNLSSMRAMQVAMQGLEEAGQRLGGIIKGFAT
ncbi:methyl-accepting chemotaxis protein [Chitinimonas sp. JJ19]|uniref:methyl-accepting chemotaxis protein n=1 Tax=Chitinimonas sp. JJ19 TaxID=3109352 RepID=UPI0030002DB4